MAMLTADRSLPASADLSAESSWPSLSWLNARDPFRVTAALVGAVELEPVELLEHAAGIAASNASAAIAATDRSLMLIACPLHETEWTVVAQWWALEALG